jgi:peptidyl-prolyl cis-trans isomerase B (cyclophilin B)
MKLTFALAVLLSSFLLTVSSVSAQQLNATPAPAAPPAPQASPAPTPAASTQKANQRPLLTVKPAPEPFDGATVEQMSAKCVTLETEFGAIELELLPEAAPETVRNFLNLSAIGAFDTTTFSRVVTDFVVQGGNLSTRPNITMELVRRSRRTIPDEPGEVRHVRGIVSMARPDQANSATTNFFILVADASFLDGKFSAFARVAHGMSIVDHINREPVENEKPVHPVRLTRAVVAPCTEKKDSKK